MKDTDVILASLLTAAIVFAIGIVLGSFVKHLQNVELFLFAATAGVLAFVGGLTGDRIYNKIKSRLSKKK